MSTRPLAIVAIALFTCAIACSKSERMPIGDFVRQVASDARPKLQVQVLLRASAEEPTDEDRALLRTLEESIERHNIGRVVTAGTQPGQLFLNVEVENTAEATTKLRQILQSAGVRDRASFRVKARE